MIDGWFAITFLNPVGVPDIRLVTCYYSTPDRAVDGMRLRYPGIENDAIWWNIFLNWIDSDPPIGSILPTEYWIAFRANPTSADRPYLLDAL